MRTTRRHSLAYLCAAILGVTIAGTSAHAAYPDKPIKIIVPWAPGGSTDILARSTAERLSQALKQPVIVENRAGASGNIGAEAAARAAADGYTLLFTSTNLTLNPAVIAHTPYDPVKDFTGITMVAFAPMMLVTKSGFAGDTLQGLMDYGKAHPGKLNFSSSGAGGAPHLAGEMFKRAAKLDMVHIPYSGAAPALADVLAGQVQMTFTTYISAQGQLAAGALKALAVASDQRLPVQPDVPTFAEKGLDIEIGTMFGLLAPAGTPASAVDTLYQALKQASADPAFNASIIKQGGRMVMNTPQDYNAYLREDTQKWKNLVQQIGGVDTN
ncbi:Bug family tripartite tricarboxylate transporter substrate binding protein [Bordetella muralis]|uniref:Bug family tripartite tricarboxylate transporter substrate binding protein n=1 Tax=Bordetella muralis TaxID=1649130 RepID=UPI0039F05FBD